MYLRKKMELINKTLRVLSIKARWPYCSLSLSLSYFLVSFLFLWYFATINSTVYKHCSQIIIKFNLHFFLPFFFEYKGTLALLLSLSLSHISLSRLFFFGVLLIILFSSTVSQIMNKFYFHFFLPFCNLNQTIFSSWQKPSNSWTLTLLSKDCKPDIYKSSKS